MNSTKSIKMHFLVGLAALILSGTYSCAQNDYIITNVNVIPMTEEGLILRNQDVKISGGKISSISQAQSLRASRGAELIDGTGKYLIPGLAEMHAHIPPQRQGDELMAETLFLYVSNGVTTIRGMLGESSHLELREQVNSGLILGPRIYTSGPSMNGNSVKTVEMAERMVTDQKSIGYDFLKLHPGLKLEVFDQIVETAKEVDIPYSGHVSLSVGVRHAIESDYASIDHIDGYVEGILKDNVKVEMDQNGFFGFNFTDLYDEKKINELAKLTAEKGVWVVPTQSLMERWAGPVPAEEIARDSEMKYMSKSTVKRWVQTKNSYTSTEDYTTERAARFIELRQKIINALNEANVGLLLGSDAPQVFNVPGFSIMNELESMVASGLTNYEALESGTANPAQFFNMEREFGTVVEGASADLILLESNPLEDISNCRNQSGVMFRGNWLSQEYITKRLAEIEAKYLN